MGVCYKCGVQQDYTDQYSVPQGAACWQCFREHHLTDEERRNSDCHVMLGLIKTILKLKWSAADRPVVNATERIKLIRAVIDEEPGAADVVYAIKEEIRADHEARRRKALDKLTYEDQIWLGV